MTAQEAFQAWAVKASLIGSGALLAVCISVSLVLFAARNGRRPNRRP